MIVNNSQIEELTVSQLLNEEKYIIPIYQRNYAWGKNEIELLIQDVKIASEKGNDKRYYIGSLIVYRRSDGMFEVIDGQQRLTTLHILAAACNVLATTDGIFAGLGIKRQLNLSFEHRQDSKDSLSYLEEIYNECKKHTSIDVGLKDTIIILNNIFRKNKESDFKNFKAFLEDKVVIFRTEVPPDTDLNHYFEIMNNRGEQLEKHEVLKANLMSKLAKEDTELFAMIWDACSDMNRYVVAGFQSEIREKIFFNENEIKNKLEQDNFDKLKEDINDVRNKNKQNKNEEWDRTEIENINILSIIKLSTRIKKYEKDIYDRFGSIINFPSFLMHVLRIYIEKKTENKNEVKKISLDDKFLLEYFKLDTQTAIKEFVFLLLKARMLFDYYVIKTDSNNNEHWSLKVPIYKNTMYYKNTYGDNKKPIMLLSMLHISYPSSNYKNWLYAVLRGLIIKNWGKDEETYIKELEKLSDQFYFNYYHHNRDFFDIIYDDEDVLDADDDEKRKMDIFHSGTGVNHFLFNRLDYLLWKILYEKDKRGTEDKENGEYLISKKDIEKFRFTYRNSIEHYYPQTPLDGLASLNNEILHNFGNLCLISREKNSKLSNNTPQAKKSYYIESGFDSLKQAIMMNYDSWTETEIEKHSKEMLDILNQKSS